MALVVKDRVKEATTTTGTGTISLDGAATGFQTFVAGIGTTNTTYYAIVDNNTGDYEVGIGTITDATPDTLSRDTILESSNAGSAVNLQAGTKDVFCTYPAEKSVYLDSSGQLILDGTAITATASELNFVDGVTSSIQTQIDSFANSLEGVKSDYVYTATASQTVFSGADDNTNTLVIDLAGLVNVFLNGVRLIRDTDYTVSAAGDSITLTTGATVNDLLEVEVFGNFTGQSGAEVGITGGLIDGVDIGNTTAGDGTFVDLTATGTTTLAGATTSADITFGDNDKAIFGAGSDLQIYHDGSNSVIKENGTGNLDIYADNLLIRDSAGTEVKAYFDTDGEVGLRYDGVTKLATTNTGIDVTGEVTTNDDVTFTSGARHKFIGGGSGNNLELGTYSSFNTVRNIGLVIDAAGKVGIGTDSPARQLDIYDDGTIGQAVLAITAQNTDPSRLMFADPDDNNIGILEYDHSDNSMRFTVNNSEAMRIDSSGRVGIGDVPKASFTSHSILQVGGQAILGANDALSSTGQTYLTHNIYFDTSGTAQVFNTSTANEGTVYAQVDGIHKWSNSAQTTGTPSLQERMRIDSSGNVGIGTSSPGAKLDVSGGNVGVSTIAGRTYQLTNVSSSNPNFVNGSGFNSIPVKVGDIITAPFSQVRTITSVTDTQLTVNSSWGVSFAGSNIPGEGGIGFNTNGVERMRLNSGGTLLVGKEAEDDATSQGVELRLNSLRVTRDGNPPMFVNRNGSDGDIAIFRKDGAPVGSIASVSGLYTAYKSSGSNLYLGVNDSLDISLDSTRLRPASDATVSLGIGGNRFTNLYLSGGVVLDDNPTAVGGSVTNKTLDDYEEGTWTPNFTTLGADFSSITYADRYGTYVKIGNLVYAQGYIKVASVSGGSGVLLIEDFPFTALTGFEYFPTGDVLPFSFVTAKAVSFQIQPGDSFAFVQYNSSATSNANMPYNYIGANTVLKFAITYRTS